LRAPCLTRAFAGLRPAPTVRHAGAVALPPHFVRPCLGLQLRDLGFWDKPHRRCGAARQPSAAGPSGAPANGRRMRVRMTANASGSRSGAVCVGGQSASSPREARPRGTSALRFRALFVVPL